MDWSSKRKFFYALAVFILIIASGIYFFRDKIFVKPSCLDGKKNGYEVDVDCGGVCALVCKQDVIPLNVLWSQALSTSSTTYDFVAMISNRNVDNASTYFTYMFTGYDKNGSVISEVHGTTTAPTDGDFPIIAQNVFVAGEIVNLTASINDTNHIKVNARSGTTPIKVTRSRYEGDGDVKRVYASIQNVTQNIYRDVPVKVVLFDEKDTAYAVGKTVVPYLGKEEERQVIFTWDIPFRKSPVKIRTYPFLDPFSQSP